MHEAEGYDESEGKEQNYSKMRADGTQVRKFGLIYIRSSIANS